MANQPEVSVFDAGVYQLETTDVVEGGVGGVDNKPLLNLANRTRWLKDNLTTLNAFPGELKWLNGKTSGFISANFPSGLGTGIYLGWAIANGANGTTDMGGKVPVAYGNTFSVINAVGGVETVTLSEAQVPVMDLSLPISDNDNAGGTHAYVMATDVDYAGFKVYTNSVNIGGGGSHTNLQPYRTVLCIQKL